MIFCRYKIQIHCHHVIYSTKAINKQIFKPKATHCVYRI
jgi:hypothetical protein